MEAILKFCLPQIGIKILAGKIESDFLNVFF